VAQLKKALLLIFPLVFCACTIIVDLDNGFPLPTSANIIESATPKGSDTTALITPPSNYLPTTPDNEKEHSYDELMIQQGPGGVSVPILLYHHITEGEPTNSYSVSKANFAEQLNYLIEHGYRTITIQNLVQAITQGEKLPQKSIVITFDDGNQNVFLNAYPLMQEKGLIGAVMIIANRVGVPGFLSINQLLELVRAGWEIGSHGMKHVDLVKEPQALRDEIANSKSSLEKTLKMKISVFAYPYGKANSVTIDWVKRIGYSAALGLGIDNYHDPKDLFYLSRREVKNEFSLVDFANLLEP